MVALLSKLFSFANFSLVTKIAAAPMDIGLLVAAVIVPSSIKAGLKLFIFSRLGSLGP